MGFVTIERNIWGGGGECDFVSPSRESACRLVIISFPGNLRAASKYIRTEDRVHSVVFSSHNRLYQTKSKQGGHGFHSDVPRALLTPAVV